MFEEIFTFSTEHAEEIARWASLIGIPIGAIAIFITLKIFKKTQKIESEQRKNAEGLYVSKTKEYLQQIHNYFNDIFGIIENHNKENYSDLITTELNLYFRKHHGEMSKLLQRSEKSLELWTSLERAKRDKFDKILKEFDWFTTKFFPLEVIDDEMRAKIWKTEYDQFLQKKYFIDNVIKEEIEAKTK